MKHLAFIAAALIAFSASWPAEAASCPEGTVQRGAAPPDGNRAWCEDSSGVRHGAMTAWHENGEIKARGQYLAGSKTGRWFYFFGSGFPRAAGAFVGGHMQGLWTWWAPDGHPSEEGEFQAGIEEGPWVFWHDSGLVSQSGVMRRGRREGWWRYWDRSGSLEDMVRYDGGTQVDVRDEDSPRYRGYGGAHSCWGYDCGSWYRHCFAGWCDPYLGTGFLGTGFMGGGGYYGGNYGAYPAHRFYGPRFAPGDQPANPPSGLKPSKKSRKSYAPPAPLAPQRGPAKRSVEPSRDRSKRRKK